jgi:phage gp16-like protein
LRFPSFNSRLNALHMPLYLSLAEATWRALLTRATGRSSAAQLSAVEREAVLAEFVRLGWSGGATARRAAEARPDHRYVLVLWRLLTEARVVQPGRAALNAFIAAPASAAKWGDCPTDLRFLTPERTRDVVEALKDIAWRNRVELGR